MSHYKTHIFFFRVKHHCSELEQSTLETQHSSANKLCFTEYFSFFCLQHFDLGVSCPTSGRQAVMVGWNRFCDLFLQIRLVLFISKIVLTSSDWSDYSNVLSLTAFLLWTLLMCPLCTSPCQLWFTKGKLHSLKKKKKRLVFDVWHFRLLADKYF